MTIRGSLPLGLLAVALVLLGAGGFIQLDDTSGFGSDAWNLPLGLLAGLVAVAAIGFGATGDTGERRTTGWALAVLATGVLAVDAVTPGFRFVWGESEGEGAMLQAGLVLGALALLLPGRGRTDGRRRVSTGTWATCWLGVTVIATLGAFWAAAAGAEGLEVIVALYAAGLALVLCSMAWVADGVRRSRR